MNEQCDIYRLSDRTGVRYVGKTERGYLKRFSDYRSGSKRRVAQERPGLYTPTTTTPNLRRVWMDSLTAAGQLDDITIALIETVPADKGAEREQFWINHYLAKGCALMNTQGMGSKTKRK